MGAGGVGRQSVFTMGGCPSGELIGWGERNLKANWTTLAFSSA